MPTSIYTFADAEISVKYHEPYASAALNKRLSSVLPPGIYRGFGLIPGPANELTIVADTIHNDNIAEYLSSDGYSISIHKTGNFNSLTFVVPGVDTTYVVAVKVNYAVGVSTTSTIQAYQLSPVDEFTGVTNLVILGTVIIPSGGGVIPANNISYTRRTHAWEALTPEATQWTPILHNGGFELSNSTAATNAYGTIAYWTCSSTNGLGYWTGADTNSHSGKYCITLKLDGAIGGGGFVPIITQQVNYPVTAGKKVKIKLWKQSLVLASAGTLTVYIAFYDNVGSATVSLPVSVNAVDGSYQLIELETIVPTGYTVLGQVSIQGSGLTFGGGGYPQVVLRLDDVQVWVENQDLMAPGSLERPNQPILTSRLSIADKANPLVVFPDAAMMSYDTGVLTVSNQSGGTLSAIVNGDTTSQTSYSTTVNTINVYTKRDHVYPTSSSDPASWPIIDVGSGFNVLVESWKVDQFGFARNPGAFIGEEFNVAGNGSNQAILPSGWSVFDNTHCMHYANTDSTVEMTGNSGPHQNILKPVSMIAGSSVKYMACSFVVSGLANLVNLVDNPVVYCGLFTNTNAKPVAFVWDPTNATSWRIQVHEHDGSYRTIDTLITTGSNKSDLRLFVDMFTGNISWQIVSCAANAPGEIVLGHGSLTPIIAGYLFEYGNPLTPGVMTNSCADVVVDYIGMWTHTR